MKESYQGETYEGNEVEKILNNILIMIQYIPEEFEDFIDTFEALRDMKNFCYGYTLESNYFSTIRKFELKWIILKIKYKV